MLEISPCVSTSARVSGGLTISQAIEAFQARGIYRSNDRIFCWTHVLPNIHVCTAQGGTGVQLAEANKGKNSEDPTVETRFLADPQTVTDIGLLQDAADLIVSAAVPWQVAHSHWFGHLGWYHGGTNSVS